MHKPQARPSLSLAVCVSLAIFSAPAAWAAATVKVSFPDPPRFTDAGNTPRDVANTTRDLAAHLSALGQKLLADGDVLTVEILDIDLAGRIESGRRGQVRIVNGRADWPSIALRYTLAGASPLAGEERIDDMDYQRGAGTLSSAEPLRYEQRMLDEWFKARLIDRKPAPR